MAIRNTFIFLCLFATWALLATGCTSPVKPAYSVKRVYHDSLFGGSWINPLPATQVHGTNESLFSIIEFDDMGKLVEPAQLDETSHRIKELRKSRPVMLMIFVHGWKHSANVQDGNLQSFYGFFKTVTAARMRNVSSNEYAVVGVYIGWRGNIFDFGDKDLQGESPFIIPTHLAYYNRDNTAKRVAGVSASQAIFTLAGLAKARSIESLNKISDRPDLFFDTNQDGHFDQKDNPQLPVDDLESRVVIAGHSMGGLIVESAVAQSLIGHMAITTAQRDVADLFIHDTTNGVDVALGHFQATLTNFHTAKGLYDVKLAELDQKQKDVSAVLKRVQEWQEGINDTQQAANELSVEAQRNLAVTRHTVDLLNTLRTALDLPQITAPAPSAGGFPFEDPDAQVDYLKRGFDTLITQLTEAHAAAQFAQLYKYVSAQEGQITNLVQSLKAIKESEDAEETWVKRREGSFSTQIGNFVSSATNRPQNVTLPPFPVPSGWPSRQEVVREFKTNDLASAEAFLSALQSRFVTYREEIKKQVFAKLRIPDREKLTVSEITKVITLTAPGSEAFKKIENAAEGLQKRQSAWKQTMNGISQMRSVTFDAMKKVSPSSTEPKSPKDALQFVEKQQDDKEARKAVESRFQEVKREHEKSGVALRSLASAFFIRSVMSDVLPADLILLINPASSALIADKLTEALNNPYINPRSTFRTEQKPVLSLPGYRPLIINLSSRGDFATRGIYWLAHCLDSTTKVFSDGHFSSEARRYRHTAPHLPEMVTHQILTNRSAGTFTNVAANIFHQPGLDRARTNEYYLRVNLLPQNGWVGTDGKSHKLLASEIITPRGLYTITTNSNSQSEYWVVDCPKELLPGHNQFWTPEFYAMVASLMRIRHLYDLDPQAAGTQQLVSSPAPHSVVAK